MATRSTDFLNVDEATRVPGRHRSRSGGYAELVGERTQWDRRDGHRRTKRYHDSHLSPSSGLYAPRSDTSHRRSRSHEDIILNQERGGLPSAAVVPYRVREVVPAIQYDRDDASTRSDEKLMSRSRKSASKRRRPSIRVEIHQSQSPRSPRSATSEGGFSKSPSPSPKSPSTIPHLQMQCATLRNKIAQVGRACSIYEDVEAANPRDLTFARIFEQIKGVGFELEVWSHVANLEDMVRIESGKRKVVEAASRTLDWMAGNISALEKECRKAKPRDLKVELLPDIDSDDGFGEDESDLGDNE